MVASLTRIFSAAGFVGAVVALVLLSGLSTGHAAEWSEGAPIGDARAFGGAAARGETVFVAGGAGLEGPVEDFAAYDTVGDIWRPLPPMPTGRQSFGIAVANDGGLYVSGGFAGQEFDAPSADLWRYDISSAVWVQMADMPAGRARHGMASVGSKLYVVGGEGPNPSRVLVYDTATADWSELEADLPASRKDLSVVAAGDQVFAIGGRTPGGVTGQVHAIDVTLRGAWRTLPALPAPRADAAAGVVGGKVHVAGGRSNDPMRTFSEHYVFDTASNRWQTAPSLPLPRLGAASAGVDGKFVVIGGSGGAGVFSFFTASDVVNIYAP
ncbi:kelch repeat-containing protein [Pyruvatibacter sp.]|uniref:Kelch repeat-containing protein n=1 Tax=Pyruvatibacter sp. TaxID=1981328 RepID=UPI0032EB8A80